MVTDVSKERVRGQLWPQVVDHRSGFSDTLDSGVIECSTHLPDAFSMLLEEVPGFREQANTVVRGRRLDAHECVLEVREQRQDGKLVGFGCSLQRIELLQLLSR
jgi:hypothetical protein